MYRINPNNYKDIKINKRINFLYKKLTSIEEVILKEILESTSNSSNIRSNRAR